MIAGSKSTFEDKLGWNIVLYSLVGSFPTLAPSLVDDKLGRYLDLGRCHPEIFLPLDFLPYIRRAINLFPSCYWCRWCRWYCLVVDVVDSSQIEPDPFSIFPYQIHLHLQCAHAVLHGEHFKFGAWCWRMFTVGLTPATEVTNNLTCLLACFLGPRNGIYVQ